MSILGFYALLLLSPAVVPPVNEGDASLRSDVIPGGELPSHLRSETTPAVEPSDTLFDNKLMPVLHSEANSAENIPQDKMRLSSRKDAVPSDDARCASSDVKLDLLTIEPISDAEALQLVVDPPSKANGAALVAMGLGIGLIATGLAGWTTTPECITWDKTGHCTGLGQPEIAYTAFLFLGTAATIAGYSWYRADAVP